MSPRTDAARRAGFTLLEAMIAVMIVGIAAVAVLSSFGTTLRTSARARHALDAEALAGQRLARATFLERDELLHLADSSASGQFAVPFAGYAWTTSAREVRGESELFDVVVRITWTDGQYTLPTRLFRPARLASAAP